MSDETRSEAEWVSALMDGQLHGEEFARALGYLENDAQAREAWDTYHLVGEVLRSGRLQTRAQDAVFIERWRSAVASDAIANEANNELFVRSEKVFDSDVPVANDAWWRRVAGLASVAFVAVLVWQAAQWMGADGSARDASTLAQAQTTSPLQTSSATLAAVQEGGTVMLRDPQLDALLAAHRQHGGATALQVPAGFLRNATFNEASR